MDTGRRIGARKPESPLPHYHYVPAYERTIQIASAENDSMTEILGS